MTYKIEVKQEHIDAGTVASCEKCPVALAMEEIGLKSVDVWQFSLKWAPYCRMETPQAVVNFMNDFDNERAVSPFTFELTDEREGA